ncbi:MAG: Stp1/IreP family PP2C-type Ser/Thr phosphatase [Oscillospiraceae bacterium]
MKSLFVTSQTDIGAARTENQDRVLTGMLGQDAALAVLCDGMGGASFGSEASETAASVIFDRISASYRPEMSANSIRNLLLTSINAANASVYRTSQLSPEKNGMGTTCVAAIADANTAYIVSVGDSRAYLIQDGGISQITEDHTYVRELFEQGKISENEIKSHRMRHVITRAVGTEREIEADYFEVELEADALLLLCSDGLSGFVSDEEIAAAADGLPAEEAARALINLANQKTSRDNITVALITNKTR